MSPDVVDFINEIISATRIETIADFYPDLMAFDVSAALPVLRHTDVLIVGAEVDMLTPVGHSQKLADALPAADFRVVAQAGHVVILERPDAVNDALVALVQRRLRAVGR